MTLGRITPQQDHRGRAIVGPALIVVCVLHTAMGVVGAGQELMDAIADGWVGAFTVRRAVALWFLMTGFVGIVAGLAITALERLNRMPWSVSLALLAVALIGVSAAPLSGFILVLAVALLAVWRSTRLRAPDIVSTAGRGSDQS